MGTPMTRRILLMDIDIKDELAVRGFATEPYDLPIGGGW